MGYMDTKGKIVAFFSLNLSHLCFELQIAVLFFLILVFGKVASEPNVEVHVDISSTFWGSERVAILWIRE
eukprot:m.135485 g.135485  ORF g.135485 m.135485 type:complete len:70 (+) comp10040_c0_seq1:1245-1454(+)